MATVTTVTDSVRGCGWRAAGGIYLMSSGAGQSCPLLPHHLHVCPTCGAGIKPTRGGWTWVNPDAMMPHHSDPETPRRHQGCPLNDPGLMGDRAGLMWIGGTYYPTPDAWLREGERLGFSRRVTGVPRGLEVGKTWILTAHRNVLLGWDAERDQAVYGPAVFHLWIPNRIEYVVKGTETENELDALEARGLTLVKVVRDQEQLDSEQEEDDGQPEEE